MSGLLVARRGSLNPRRAAGGTGVFVPLDGIDDFVETPDTAALSVTGDIDLRADVALDDWSSTSQAFISKYTGTDRSWLFHALADGKLRVLMSFSGTTALLFPSTAAVSAANGARLQVRATFDVSADTARFYTRASGDLTDDTGWTQLGSAVTDDSFADSIHDSATPVQLGAFDDTSYLMAGEHYGAVIKDGIDGTLVGRFDPSDGDVGDTSVTDSDTSIVWTITGSSLSA